MAGVQAGRLSIEIVAEIARLQQDLDKAKRAVREASGDIARSATAANDNLSRLGTGMNNVGTMSRAMRGNMINLGRQVQDVGTMFALGAPPMQIFASQGAQIADVLAMMSAEAKAANTSLTAMAGRGLMRASPYILAASVAATALAASLSAVTDEINENSDVTVTWGDVVVGTFDAVKSYIAGAFTSTMEAWGIDMGEIMAGVATMAKRIVNNLIGDWVFAVNAIKAAWRTFPAAIAEFVIDAANRALTTIEGLINGGIRMLNAFAGQVKAVLGREIVGQIDEVDIPALTNTFRGAGSAAGAAMAEAQAGAYRDYVDEFIDYTTPFIQDAARRRLEEETEKTGRRAGRRAGRAARQSFEEAFADLMQGSNQFEALLEGNRDLSQRIADQRREAQAIGMVGLKREELVLTLEYQADAQDLLNQRAGAERAGMGDLVDALNRQIQLRRELYDWQILNAQATDASAAAAEREQQAKDRIVERFGDMDEWLGQLNLTAEQMTMAFEQIQRDGVDALTDGLVDVMTGFRSVGDVARSVLSQILADLLRLQIQQSIMGPLTSALGMMGSAGGPSAGLLGSVTNMMAANPGLFAKGTLSAPAGMAIVGEEGPELVRLRGGERIYPAGQTQQMLGASTTINVNVTGAMNERQARETGNQIARRIRREMHGIAA